MNQRYKINRKKTGRGGVYTSATLTVPNIIADRISEETVFELELTTDGILYRFIGAEEELIDLPGWLETVPDLKASA